LWIEERAETLTYLVPQPQPAISKAGIDARAGASTNFRSTQKRWPMALSIWAAVAVSLAMWAGIAWVVSQVLGLFI
jgi:hypothetical protein